MTTFILLAKLLPEMAANARSMEEKDQQFESRCLSLWPELRITTQLALLGPYDLMYVVEAPSEEDVFGMTAALRASGMVSSVETWTAIKFTYPKMMELLRGI